MVLDIFKFYKLLEVTVNLKIKILHMHEYLISDKKSKNQKKNQRKYLKTGRKNNNYSYQTNQMIFHIRDLANNFGMQHLKDSLIHK